MSLRMTKLRRTMLAILEKNDGPLSVPDLTKKLKKKGISSHKTSLYRNLEKLVEDGHVQEVLLDTSSVHYEREGMYHHHHALCSLCARVVCVAHEIVEKGVKHLEEAARAHGFASMEHHIVLKGLCNSCQKAS